jgi:hypothetical protein
MRIGRDVNDLAAEIVRQAESKKDYLVNTADLEVGAGDSDGGELMLAFRDPSVDFKPVVVGATAHQHFSEQLNIPMAYYRRMQAEAPDLLATSVNRWMGLKPRKATLRTLDGKARALMSDKFRTDLDNIQLAEAALPAIQAANMEIVSCELTETRLYIKAVDKSIQRHIPSNFRMGDGSHHMFRVPSGDICPAIQIQNSEIGYASLSITGGWLDGGCTNLAWFFRERGLKKIHVGARLDVGDELYRMLSDDTKNATDIAIWKQFRDAVKAAISEEGFDDLVGTLTKTAQNQIEGDPVKCVEITAKKFGLTDNQRGSVLQHLIRGGDLSQFGLANAVTSAANETEDYDNATALEGLGGKIIELKPTEWVELAKAA